MWRVFTERYALSPYIKQIRFVFKGLILNTSFPKYTKEVISQFCGFMYCKTLNMEGNAYCRNEMLNDGQSHTTMQKWLN
jgi:hypothetical protein